MEMRAGYKQTELGIFPQDWVETSLGSLATFRTGPFGSALHKSDYVIQGVPVVNPMQIVDGKIIPTPSMTISDDAARKLSEFRLTSGEVVIGRRGDMGRCALVGDREDGWLCGTGSMIVRPKSDLSAEFAQRVLSSRPVIRAIESSSVGTTMTNLNQGTLANLKIVVPPSRAEQEAIAEALSDADALIESLEQLVAKKRQIKQGAMQELLTGKRRLPGCSGEWRLRRLGELLTIVHGKNQHEVEDAGGPYPILATGGRIGSANRFLYDKPSVLIGRKGTIDQPQYMDSPFWTVDTLFYSIVHLPNDAKFLYYRFCLIDWMQHNEASGVPSLNAKTIERIEIAVPMADEQAAISAVLSEMDAGLAVLQSKLTKARAIKQGMMQELLTGRIRLV